MIATSEDESDDDLERFSLRHSIPCFRGDLNNVSKRFLDACETHDVDLAVRINGDNLFINPYMIDQAISFISKDVSFVSNVPRRTYPKGMSVEVVKVSEYRNLYSKFSLQTDFEHVTQYLYRNEESIHHVYMENSESDKRFDTQLAIDTTYDFILARKIMEGSRFKDYRLDMNALINKKNEKKKSMNFSGMHGPLLIAEIGGNHQGDFEYAKKLTELAIASGADYIKLQMYSGDTLVNPTEDPQRLRHFEKFELTRENYVELAQLIVNSGKKFMASIWNESMLDWVEDYVHIYKVGSGDLLTWPLLKTLAAREKPIILSTGLATEDEVVETVKYIRSCNAFYEKRENIGLLQCTSMYPTPSCEANLNVMKSLKNITGATVGYSDHTEGGKALETAFIMGAEILEFHFTDDRTGKEFRDHKVSLTQAECLDFIEQIKLINSLKGYEKKHPTESEIDTRHTSSFRRAVYPARDIPAGVIIRESDLVVLRPAHGLSSHHHKTLLGMRTTEKLSKYQPICFEQFKVV